MRSRPRRLRYELLETRDLLATVQISDEIVGPKAGRVTVPVNIDDVTGVRAAEIRIQYDTTQLDVQPKDIAPGSAWAGKALALPNIDEQAGTIVVFLFATESLAGGSGSLVDVSFTVRSDALAAQAAIDLAEVRLNEGQVALQATPVSGTDSTDGLIRIKREFIHQRTGSPSHHRGPACVAEGLGDSQVVIPQPLEHIAPTHPFQPPSGDKPARLLRNSKFIGPIADHLFATTDRWLYWR